MAIEAGTRLGPYEISKLLGKGGMGEVYLARDTRLSRDVAIKVLPAGLGEDSSFQKRFEREAKTISQLQHPNVCTLYDVGSEDGVDYLVMEYLEGETLEDLLTRGAPSFEDALRIGGEIAEAIEAAHRRSIVHRDLKPGNVMLTAAGTKVLDFGLARGETTKDVADAATMTAGITQEGQIVGTMPYMAPEQLQGGQVDTRSDIWALGCILYEMVAGERPFSGQSRADLVASILRSDPGAATTKQALAPRRIDWIVQRCLEKDPERRWQSARDVAIELSAAGDSAIDAVADESATARRPMLAILGGAFAVLAGVGGLVLGLALRSTAEAPIERPVRRFAESTVEIGAAIHSIAMSSDGRLVAVASPVGTREYAQTGESGPLMLRRIGATGLHPIAGTEMGEFPFFSPDGEWLAFFTTGVNDLEKIPVGGGPVTTLAEGLGRNWGGSWGDDGWIVHHSIKGGDGLSRLPALGGLSEVITRPNTDRGERSHRWPDVLPGAQQVLFTIWKGSSDASEVALLTLPEGEIRSLVTGTFGRYVDSGHLVFFDGSFMMVAPLDLEEGRITANPVRVPGIESGGFWGYRSLALSRDGLLALAIRPTSRLLWVDREGRETPIRLPPASYRSPALSPRGDRLAVSMSQGGRSSDIWLFDADGGGPRQLTERGENLYPMWINEDWIAFQSEWDGVRTTYRKRADSSGDTEVLIPGEHGYPLDATPDGRWVSINYLGDIWLLSLEGGELRSLVETPFNEANAFFSPDGRWYTYHSVEFEEIRGHVALLDGSSGRLTLDGSNFSLMWSPAGDEIFSLRMGDPPMMSVRSFAGGRLGPHRDLFPWPYVIEGARVQFDTDGERFLVIREDDSPTIRYVENWFEEVRGLLPK